MRKPEPFGMYYLLEPIGGGGMGEVFRAMAFGGQGFARLVAIKRLLPSLANDRAFIAMFIDEAKLVVKLNHANIAQIFDLGEVNGSYYIALEHVHGRDLRAIFLECRSLADPVPVAMACHVVMQACAGLDYAHNTRDGSNRELGIVHRDVSLHNILVSFDGEVKLIDFGVAKAADRAGRTQTGALVGKLGYLSPEQVRGKPVDRRSDVFACGIILYELLTGERLFVGATELETLEQISTVAILPPSTYNRRIPDELERIVLKSLARDVEDRYQNAADLHDELQAFVYTAGEFFGRNDLAAWMRQAFAAELAEERARLAEFQALRLSPPAGARLRGQPPPVPPRRTPAEPAEPAERTVTRSVMNRVGPQLEVSNVRALETLQQAARLTSEAARAKRGDDGRSKRLFAALQCVQAVETALLERLCSHFDDEERRKWCATRTERGVDGTSGREKAMTLFLEKEQLPSLTVLGGWLKPATAPRPVELAATVAVSLGMRPQEYATLFTLASTRNALAHLVAYQNQPEQSIQGAADYLVETSTEDGRRRLDVPPDRLRALEVCCAAILTRTARPDP